MVTTKGPLCAFSDLKNPGARGFRLVGQPPFFIVRVGASVYGYVNSCPHRNTPLDWRPETFLSYDKDLIQCSTHGARFRIADGACVSGPCPGKSLEPIGLTIRDGIVYRTD